MILLRFFGWASYFAKKIEKLSQQQLLILAAVVSILFTVVLYIYLSNITNKENASQPANMTTVVVAKKDIPARTAIDESMVKTESVPSDTLPAQPMQDIRDAVGKIAQVPIMAGDVVTIPKMFMNSASAGFIGTIPDDCRAISVKISDITGVAGFAKAGDYVDIILVSDKSDKNKVSGKIIIQNVLLLGINKSFQKQDGAGNGTDNNKASDNLATATLALQPSDALKLAVAQTEGTIFLELRPLNPRNYFVPDTEYFIPQYNGSNNANTAPAGSSPQPFVSGGAAPAAVQPSAPATSAAASDNGDSGITIIRGTTKGRIEVQ